MASAFESSAAGSGPLAGVRVIEMAGLGALPFGATKLADMGADVIRVERPGDVPADRTPRPHNFWDRGRRSIAVDLKHPEGAAVVLRLAERADVFLESFRPGVAERLGIGPQPVLARNPRIVYGRLTGWGQDGPLAHAAGHALNYEALTGFTRSVGSRGGPPVPVLQVVADFAGGGLHLAYGVVCALLEARRSGRGQVVDAAMVDGVMSLLAPFYAMHAMGLHTDELGTNLFDGGAPFYAVYETADGRWVSVAAIEPQFWAQLLAALGIDPASLPAQHDRAGWPATRERLAAVFRTRTREEWCARLEGTDACFAPVLTLGEARTHPHAVARGAFVADGERPELLPSPRLSVTPGRPRRSPAYPGADTEAVLREVGFDAGEIERLRAQGAVR
ncbi:MAG TPA: CaiB/BaiF CoA-transferase family protein [Candidatus Limnocylindria bacterium]|nr:CaiB/BaiF CoA-transferase family protein [Candidatus Limnocylindria bacterium]